MKKLLLIISLLLPMVFSGSNESIAFAEEINNDNKCVKNGGIVRIIDNKNDFVGNGFVYKVDNNHSYIITSSKVDNEDSVGAIFDNGSYSEITFLGKDNHNEVAVFKSDMIDGIRGVCVANAYLLDKGEKVAMIGYSDIDELDFVTGIVSGVGELYSNEDYIRVYRDIVQIDNNGLYDGAPLFNSNGNLVGMANGTREKMVQKSFSVNSNKLVKIADSIVKYGKYEINYIKYTIVDYSSLSVDLRESYDVSNKVSSGVVVTTFKVFNYVFGKLNQGMVIVAVNDIEIKNVYDLDVQLTRYNKGSKVCFKVIKNNGKEAYHYIKI